MNAFLTWILAILAWLLAFPTTADAARIDLRPGSGMHAADVYIVGDMSLQAAQIVFLYDLGRHMDCPVSAANFDEILVEADSTSSGRSMLAILNYEPIEVVGEAWLATVQLDGSSMLSVAAYGKGGIPTRLLAPGSVEHWDGYCDSIGLPEPTTALLLAFAALAVRRA